MSNSFYTDNELKDIGFKEVGKNVLISRKASIYGSQHISIGDNTRIDDFCILSGNISIGSNVHISAYCALYGAKAGIILKDYSGLSARCTLYAETDDFDGTALVGPMVEIQHRKLIVGCIEIEKYVQVGAGCVILPKVNIGEGASIGSMSLINKSLEPWSIYIGIPARKLRDRSKDLLKHIDQK